MDYSFDLRFCARGMRYHRYRKYFRLYFWHGIGIGLRQRHRFFTQQLGCFRQLWFRFQRFLKHVQPKRRIRFLQHARQLRQFKQHYLAGQLIFRYIRHYGFIRHVGLVRPFRHLWLVERLRHVWLHRFFWFLRHFGQRIRLTLSSPYRQCASPAANGTANGAAHTFSHLMACRLF